MSRTGPSAATAAVVRRFALLLLVVPGTVGCGQVAADRIPEEGIEVEVSDDEVSVRSGDRTITSGRDLPALLPESLPLPEDLEVIASVSEETDGIVEVGLQAFASGSYTGLTDFFSRQLPAAGWTVLGTSQDDLGGVRATVWLVEGSGFRGTITATELGEVEDGAGQLSVAISLESG